MIALVSFFLLVTLVVSVSIRLVAALLSQSIRDSVVRHPVVHIIWLVAGLAAFLILFFTWFLPMTKLPPVKSMSSTIVSEYVTRAPNN
jgi:hypothetical protein